VQQEHQRAVALLDDMDANAIGSNDLLAANVHGRAVWRIAEMRAARIYAVYNEPSCQRLLIRDGLVMGEG
jgi:hypothetical protein